MITSEKDRYEYAKMIKDSYKDYPLSELEMMLELQQTMIMVMKQLIQDKKEIEK